MHSGLCGWGKLSMVLKEALLAFVYHRGKYLYGSGGQGRFEITLKVEMK